MSIVHDVIRSQYCESLTLDQLSRLAALSPNHLIRSYRQLFNVTPHQHVISLRLQEAGRLLKDTKLTVLEICHAVGFESLGSFSSSFRRKMGYSPNHYRTRETGDFG